MTDLRVIGPVIKSSYFNSKAKISYNGKVVFDANSHNGWDLVYSLFAMGCSSSLYRRNNKTFSASFNLNSRSTVLSFSEETKNILKESWKLVEPVKTAAGKKMFQRYVRPCYLFIWSSQPVRV